MARILILVENLSVPFDRRVWQESRALTRGRATRSRSSARAARSATPSRTRRIDGVEIHRYALEAATGGPAGYLKEYGTALWHSLRLARKLDRERPFDVVQACNPPDLLFLVALPLKLRGARFVFDHHDLVPELFRSRFGAGGPLLWAHRAARARDVRDRRRRDLDERELPQRRARRAAASAPEPHHGRAQRARPHALRAGRARRRRCDAAAEHLVCYLGVMGPQDGVDYALRALASCATTSAAPTCRPRSSAHGDAWDDLVALAHELGLDDCVEFTGRVSDDDVARYLSTADVCLAPDPKNPLNDVSTMNKIVEYMAMSRPIVSFDLIEARVSAGDAALYATPNDEREFARLIAELLDDPERRAAHGRARPAARRAGALVGALPRRSCSPRTRRCWPAAVRCAALVASSSDTTRSGGGEPGERGMLLRVITKPGEPTAPG